MASIPHWTEVFELTGVGTSYAKIECYPSPARGVLNTVPSIRSTGGATALTNIWFVRDTAVSLVVGVPTDDYVVADGAAITLTASDTDRSTSTAINASPFFNRGLGIVVYVTASGAWSLFVTIEFADLDAAGVT